MKLVTVQTFDNAIDVALLKSKLESEGVICYVFDEYTVTINPLLSTGIGGIKLKINENDAEKALLILKEIQEVVAIDEKGKNQTCPNCGSIDLYVDFRSMKGVKGFLSMIIMFAFVIYPLYYKNVYKCKNCDYEFK
jgi:hypothetical protein